MKRLIKAINNIFAQIILFVFYFLGIGLGALIYGIFKKKEDKKDSYWTSVPNKLSRDDFQSPY